MKDLNPEFIEKYQIIYQKDPLSKVFAPLSEAYRKMGLIEQALEVAEKGVRHHPNFVSGRVALAKIYYQQKRFKDCTEQLEKAVEISTENILAHRLLGECYLECKNYSAALRAFKMVLFLNPNDEKAQKMVKQLELITATDYGADLFQLEPPKFDKKLTEVPAAFSHKTMERFLSLIDAFILRSDFHKALLTLNTAEEQLGKHPDFERRIRLIKDRTGQSLQSSKASHRKIDHLRELLQRIEDRRLKI